jgi:hypothetical protein
MIAAEQDNKSNTFRITYKNSCDYFISILIITFCEKDSKI